ncbi:conserved hypothetical protein [Bathymodiolus platifrons methanotrophic gill symbiont]|uniref:DUF1249 domain-containing protein n=1 Tax=Bathymodiolus platifrons methanotrophic gill symbiont TaxID=113268 RepID=UPI000B41168A|nr:DUF1249 domain-containing protein [Bathymodiolus platifrons methanotrophic gill symbiont]TXK93331.1 DUF1249 domain-containing protein [Methylococcaceae bacterium HT1]TXL08823.1 DUF1249 domain-containing protein [Methylococcaceae bacterium CS1]TXL15056.1 DUF1249 domain-containing protein [Methylococcaceae bacterium HT4]TXL18625.1 DUF1249 domain-containing protein [Methylococcaceae bacterium HT3]TXL21368.1 DUF1249 domain-containing protein [Methylococcaceae bacterium HT5]TXL23539.1 DUF1249 d
MAKVSPLNKSFCLQNVCESNYHKLFSLIPNLRDIDESAQGFSDGKPMLHMQILEQSPYTKTIQLSHLFANEAGVLLEPAVKIRMYFDVCIAEVLRDYKRVEVATAIEDIGLSKEIMDYKWRLNYFLDKWLDHCLKTDYIFVSDEIAA